VFSLFLFASTSLTYLIYFIILKLTKLYLLTTHSL
jgi:hypothetical protein